MRHFRRANSLICLVLMGIASLDQIAFPATVSSGANYSQNGAHTATVTHVYTFANGDGANGEYEVSITDPSMNSGQAGRAMKRRSLFP